MKRVRCAIYTRKSSDEGLEQSFNSLDAQREACAAYILSQTSEGWTEVRDHYDDGGISGGTLARPALQRLLADIAAGKIDIVVVYKVDRLTRSLLDFSKLVEAFDRAEVSFVSVTQSFNTTTSMGRLTLNMLLSFAQFEREVTAERIRDKIAASKAKGMWMGGIPPLGYAPNGRSLAIIEEHAVLVRRIFTRYLELGCVRLLADELKTQKVAVPSRSTKSGTPLGGGWFSRGQLYHILSRPTYVGDIAHKELTYPGTHPPIIERETFTRVQQMLAENRGTRRTRRETNRSVLAGNVVDAEGEPLVAVHTMKGKLKYRYYVSRALHHKHAATGMRIPAREIETLVAGRLADWLDDPLELIAAAWLDVPAHELDLFSARCQYVAAKVRKGDRALISGLVERVQVGGHQVEIGCAGAALAEALEVSRAEGAPGSLALLAKVRVARSGQKMRLIDGGEAAGPIDLALVRLLIRARAWWAELRKGEIEIAELARREGMSRSYVSRVTRLAFLAPQAVEAILDGSNPGTIGRASLVGSDAIPMLWQEQARGMLA